MTFPNFLIVGAPKAGTTALVEALRRHPQIFLPAGRIEPGFFAWDIGLPDRIDTWRGYEDLFSNAKDQHLAVGEKTVWYLSSPAAPQAIATHLPSVKVIVAVRDPIEMIYALHRQQLLDGNETIADFATALGEERLRRRGRSSHPVRFVHGVSYSLIAEYPHQVRRYKDVLGRERVLVVPHKALKTSFQATMRQIFRFLGVRTDLYIKPSYPRENREIRSLTLHRLLQQMHRGSHPWLDWLPGRDFFRFLKASINGINSPPAPRPSLPEDLMETLLDRFRDVRKWLDAEERRMEILAGQSEDGRGGQTMER